MAVRFDTDSSEFVIDSDSCEDCETPLYDTGCDAPGCTGRCCMDCGTGCDLELMGDDGRCARASEAESQEDYDARCNAERTAFGLSPLAPAPAGEYPGTSGPDSEDPR